MKKISMFFLLLLTLALGTVAASTGSLVVLAASEGLVFALVALFSFCRHRESLWIFVLSVPLLLSFNIRICYDTFCLLQIESCAIWFRILFGIQEMAALLGAELLPLCLLARILWEKQYPFGK